MDMNGFLMFNALIMKMSLHQGMLWICLDGVYNADAEMSCFWEVPDRCPLEECLN